MGYDYDSIKPARVLIGFLKFFGLWSFKSPFYKFYGWCLHFFFTFLFIVAMYVNVAKMDNIDNFANALYMSLTETVLLVKVLNILTASRNVVDFLATIEQNIESQPRNEKELQMMVLRKNSFNKLRNTYITICVALIIISDGGSLLSDNYKIPFPCWIPFAYHNSNYLYAYFYVAIGMCITALTNMAIDLLQAYFLLQLAVFYELIALRLERYGHEKEDMEELKEIMRLHTWTESMVVRCQKLISWPVFTQVVMSAFILCFTIYQLRNISLLTDPIDFILIAIFAFTMTMQIYLPCFYGNEVTLTANALTGAVYNSNWVELSAESRKTIFIYMENLKRPIVLKAGNFFTIGMMVFTKTINNAYSLFALLLNMD